MLTENQEKWVEALRSGDYEQTQGCLQDSKGYCCLGVACVVYEKETGWKLPRNTDGFYSGIHLGLSFSKVRRWLGLNGNEAPVNDPDIECLTGLNDEKEYTFEQIAEVIESEPEGLFV